jgi:hypothetical protein
MKKRKKKNKKEMRGNIILNPTKISRIDYFFQKHTIAFYGALHLKL